MSDAMIDVPVRTVRVIWFVLLMSIVIYGVIAWMVVGSVPEGPFAEAIADPLVIGFYAGGVGAFVMAFIMSSAVHRRTAMRGAPRPPASPAGEMLTVPPRTRVALVVRWSLIEACAVFGLVAAFLESDPRLFLPLGALAIAGMLLNYPTDERLRDMAG
jgi:hypothetical protein